MLGFAGAAYASYVSITWFRYGKPRTSPGQTCDALLDMFMPQYEVVERHQIRIAAPADLVLTCAAETDPESSAVVRGIFRTRELLLGSQADDAVRPRGLLAMTKSLGWGQLAELPGREIVMGGVTQPWMPNPVFRALPPDEFAAFNEPGYVKIVWTLRADPVGNSQAIFRTETRATATDVEAREKFRWYWSFLSPGIILIRGLMLPAVKEAAEKRWQSVAA
jgi:hypothetical protein